ncbi:prevent-host-death family protein, partial [Acidithiobacillus sp. GGI-221]
MREEMEHMGITEDELVAGFKEWRKKLMPRRRLVVDAN